MGFSVVSTPEEVVSEIGRRLAALRISRKLTQAELALRSGVSKRVVERLENGMGRPALESFVQICCALSLQDRFKSLIPEQTPSPADILLGRKAAKRVRHAKGGTAKGKAALWGTDP